MTEIRPWIVRVQPETGESLSHYLGRFRRANVLSQRQLTQLITQPQGRNSSDDAPGQRALIQGWETPSRQRQPTTEQLERLSQITEVDVAQLESLLPPKSIKAGAFAGANARYLATRLCSQCYQEKPIHRQSWQIAANARCPEHNCLLLRECPACKSAFRLPSLWEIGRCERCWLPFVEMAA